MSNKIVIIDYGMGNLSSVKKIFDRLNIDSFISSKPKDILNADKIILPGVGHFQKAMENLNKLHLIGVLNEMVLVQQKPILGICLGMQLMGKTSQEGNIEGFGWIDAEVVKFKVSDKLKYKIPHMGWNQVVKSKESRLMQGVDVLSEFYFVHSFYMKVNNSSDILSKTEYEDWFVSSIEKNNIFGVQYHPEKSHDSGNILLKNFTYL
jgi:imidazole glycerol-phosphate synthase subunit HisH